VTVNGAEGGVWRVVGSRVEVSDQGIHASDKVNFVLQEPDQAHLNIVGEAVEAADARVGALLYLSTHHIIIARQNDLNEIGVGQVTVLITVEEANETSTVANVGRRRVLSEELEHSASIDALLGSSVQSTEG